MRLAGFAMSFQLSGLSPCQYGNSLVFWACFLPISLGFHSVQNQTTAGHLDMWPGEYFQTPHYFDSFALFLSNHQAKMVEFIVHGNRHDS